MGQRNTRQLHGVSFGSYRSMTGAQAAEKVHTMFCGPTYPVDLTRVIEYVGPRVLMRGGALDDAFKCSGRLYLGGVRPLIELNCNQDRMSQRFLAAHLLGHYLLGHQGVQPETSATLHADVQDARERAANEFAACLLMPAGAIETNRRAPIEQLALAFQVSTDAVTNRLSELDKEAELKALLADGFEF